MVILLRNAYVLKAGKSLPVCQRGTPMISSTQNPTPGQNKRPEVKSGVQLTDAEKKVAAAKAAAQSGSKS